jgi:hypothetical protein
VAAERRLPPYASWSFSSWCASRVNRLVDGPTGSVTVVASREVERFAPWIGRDLVHVLERNGVACGEGPEIDVEASAGYLMDLHSRGLLDTTFVGPVPHEVAVHGSDDAAALVALTGSVVHRVAGPTGVEEPWRYGADRYEDSRRAAAPLREAILAASFDVVACDTVRGATAIEEETGERPLHPVQLLARAYGLPEDPP